MGKVLKVRKIGRAADSVVSRTVADVEKKIQRKSKSKRSISWYQKILKIRKAAKKRRRQNFLKELGVLYVSHIPHGFYEEGLTNFFSQFGRIKKVKLVRSTVSGRSKGYAFIIFRYKEVATIAAETTNNYLMGKRILKAKVIPYEEVKPKWFWFETTADCTKTLAAKRRKQVIQHLNKRLTGKESRKRMRAHKASLRKMMGKLKERGIALS